MDFLWHKVDDKEKEEITKQAKAIMDSSKNYLGELTEAAIKNPTPANKARLAMHMDKFGSIQRSWMDAGE